MYSKLKNNDFEYIVSYYTKLNQSVEKSAKRDLDFWDNQYVDYDKDMDMLRIDFIEKIKWLDEVISQF